MKSLKNKLTIPNLITSLRIFGSIIILFIKPLTPLFLVIYTVIGISDVADGIVARATGSATEFGAKLDSISDMLFYAVMIYKMFPTLWSVLPIWIWITGWSALAIRIVSYICAACKYKKFASIHTYLNKLTGFLVFMIPYSLLSGSAVEYIATAAIIACLASTEELIIHLSGKTYKSDTKTIIKLLK